MANEQVYSIGEGWKGILAQAGVDHADVLRRARLPEDLLNRDTARLTVEGFVRFWEALDASVRDAAFWVRFTEAMKPEYFTPPMFAALCSPNLATAAERLARFKPLMGPIELGKARVDVSVEGRGRGSAAAHEWPRSALRDSTCATRDAAASAAYVGDRS